MLTLAVLPQRFAVVAEHDDQAPVIKLIALEPGDQASEFVIGVSNLPVIQMPLILRVVRRGWIVGAVRIIKVQPKEKRSLMICLQPSQRPSYTLFRLAIDQAEVPVLELLG